LDGRAGANLDDLAGFSLGVGDFVDIALACTGQPADLVLHGLLTRLVGPLHDDLKALVILEQAGIEFGLDGATGGRTGEAGQADLLRDARMEFQHWESSHFRGNGNGKARRVSRGQHQGRMSSVFDEPPKPNTPMARRVTVAE
jgi:hypothetical protein